ncbi:MAG: CBS domain protein [Pseudolabrys sp.]|jgi:CBS domain-containing protein|nr:CBS domain protein [Pseudolabrys sp.]
MKVSEIMTREVELAHPSETITHAAKLMASLDAGALPVADGDRLVGMITDRDIAIRGVGQGLGPNASVGDVMTREVMYCYDDQDLDEITENMGEIQVRRLPVLNRGKRLVGIVALGDIAFEQGATNGAGEALSRISEPRGRHSQSV